MKIFPEYPTPYVLFDKNIIKQNVNLFEKGLPGVNIRYAMKSNPYKGLCQEVADNGAGFEIASVGELEILKEIGVQADKIIFSAPVKIESHIKEVFDYGVREYIVDCLEEVEKLAENAPNSKVMVRVEVDEDGSIFSLKDKFGAYDEQVIPIFKRITELGLEPHGIAFHVGSQALNPEAWAKGIHSVKEHLDALGSLGIKLSALDIGGGFPFNYDAGELQLNEIFESINRALDKLGLTDMQIIVEPGRAMCANSMNLITSVVQRTKRHNEWLYLDAGTYNWVFEAMDFQGGLKFAISQIDPRTDALVRFTVGGPTCDSIDTISKASDLPEDVKVGDRVLIENVGGYSYAFASKFNGFEVPKIYDI